MKFYNGCFVTLLIILVFAPTAAIYAQENDIDTNEDIETKDDKNSNRPYIVLNEGVASSWLTRIVKKTERSNFVFEDFLVGLYCRVDLENIKYVTPIARLAVYYPMTQTFNKVPQLPKNPLHYSLDLNIGIKFDILDLEYFRLNLGPALHLFFLNAERWNYLDLGGTVFLGMEVPLTKNWTFLCGGFASLDNGNLGANRRMEPFDIAYQYQIEIGVRYSKKITNRTFLFAKKPQAIETGDAILTR